MFHIRAGWLTLLKLQVVYISNGKYVFHLLKINIVLGRDVQRVKLYKNIFVHLIILN